MFQRARKAFTLVELLVVMAILALLSVLLLAALRFAYHAARNTQCLNNLAEIGRGLNSFANRNKQWGPPGPPNSYSTVQPSNILWVSTPEWSTPPRRVPPPYPMEFATRPSNWLNHGFLWRDRDLTDERVYYCPDAEGNYNVNVTTGSGPTAVTTSVPTSSFVNSGPFGFDNTVALYETNPMPPPGLKWFGSYDYRSFYTKGTYYPINFGKQSAETAVIADAVQNPGGVRRAHNNQIYNVVFADGHGVSVDDAAGTARGGYTYQVRISTMPDVYETRNYASIASMNIGGTNWSLLENVFLNVLSRP